MEEIDGNGEHNRRTPLAGYIVERRNSVAAWLSVLDQHSTCIDQLLGGLPLAFGIDDLGAAHPERAARCDGESIALA